MDEVSHVNFFRYDPAFQVGMSEVIDGVTCVMKKWRSFIYCPTIGTSMLKEIWGEG